MCGEQQGVGACGRVKQGVLVEWWQSKDVVGVEECRGWSATSKPASWGLPGVQQGATRCRSMQKGAAE